MRVIVSKDFEGVLKEKLGQIWCVFFAVWRWKKVANTDEATGPSISCIAQYPLPAFDSNVSHVFRESGQIFFGDRLISKSKSRNGVIENSSGEGCNTSIYIDISKISKSFLVQNSVVQGQAWQGPVPRASRGDDGSLQGTGRGKGLSQQFQHKMKFFLVSQKCPKSMHDVWWFRCLGPNLEHTHANLKADASKAPALSMPISPGCSQGSYGFCCSASAFLFLACTFAPAHLLFPLLCFELVLWF